ncbi:hypothetical protein OE88DRAFT_1655265 [Heliocybe sulcata]|uniref:Uncharacterized protein n=1 Tax=Heliocybe sulcata TaxID=5364 RepID=A0A5C3N9N8_9AGAM|nr:hypothetical protein OE88DRAFT_1655265 [Heliocybe sulcata]
MTDKAEWQTYVPVYQKREGLDPIWESTRISSSLCLLPSPRSCPLILGVLLGIMSAKIFAFGISELAGR